MIKISKAMFGRTAEGEEVYSYTLENSSGMRAAVLSYAGCIRSLAVPDRNGNATDVVLGYDSVEEYEADELFFGVFVGRYANRIGGAEFALNGRKYTLPRNDGNNHLHGTFTRRVFPMEITGDSVVLHGFSPDGEEGFPGALSFDVSYTLSDENELIISYRAAADTDTVINLTNHSYFNLNGQDGSTVLNHTLRLNSSCFTETDAHSIPTGRILPVDGTPMDFRKEKQVGLEIDAEYEQIRLCRGYDNNYVLDNSGHMSQFAELSCDRTGIVMHCFTDQPGVQLYTGNFIDGKKGKNGVIYPCRGALCLETQHYPDSPNHPEFPTTVLKDGEEFNSTTVYQFSII